MPVLAVKFMLSLAASIMDVAILTRASEYGQNLRTMRTVCLPVGGQ